MAAVVEAFKDAFVADQVEKQQRVFDAVAMAKVREELLTLIPGETDWPLWDESMLSHG